MHALWYGRSVRAQLLLVFTLIDLVAVFIAGGGAITGPRAKPYRDGCLDAPCRTPCQRRRQFRASAASGRAIPGGIAGAAAFDAPCADRCEGCLWRSYCRDAACGYGRRSSRDEHASAPAWFAALVASPIETRNIPVIVDGQSVGQVQIIGEPADEIAEFWGNAVAIGTVAVVLNVAMIGILYVLFGRVLDPLTVLARGLSDLERQTYDVRLPRPHARELAVIADRFNALARTLATVSAENVRLNRRLITAQDDERRRTALELHDEVGPCLFGLKANASSIASAAGDLPDKARQSVSERLRDILGIIEHLQAINRSMLDRLRPMSLGHVPLKEIVGQLVHERSRQHSQISFSFTAEDLSRSYGDSIDLTIYRCVQESLTNAIRHAQAERVTVELGHADAEGWLALTVRDDGCGMHARHVGGLRHCAACRSASKAWAAGTPSKAKPAAAPACVSPFRSSSRGMPRRLAAAERREGMTSVLIIDDHPIVLQGCRRMLEDAGVAAVLEARDAASGYRLYRRHRPDVIIIDLAMNGSGLAGLPLIRRINAHDPRARILVFSMHSDPIIVARALEAGATGYVLKDTSSEDLMEAFEKVRAGTPYLSNDLAMQVALVRTPARQNPLADLTPRELQTFRSWPKANPMAASPRSSTSATRPSSMSAPSSSRSLMPATCRS